MHTVFRRFRYYLFVDLVLLAMAFYLLWTLGAFSLRDSGSIEIVAISSVLALATGAVMGLYRPNVVVEPKFQARCFLAVVCCILIVGIATNLFEARSFYMAHVVGAVTLSLVCMMALRVALHRLSVKTGIGRSLMTILPRSQIQALGRLLDSKQIKIVATPSETVLSAPERQALIDALHGCKADEIVISDGLRLDPALAMELVILQRRGLRVVGLNQFMSEEFGRLPHDDPETLSQLVHRTRPRSWVALAPKRVMDVTLSLILLILLLPVMVIAAVIVRASDGGPMLYRQIRVGMNQRHFTLMKFRSMRVDAEANGVARWAEQRDSRITPFGAFMRLTRIDELPQLLNVLKGDMSLVGPRPERPEFIAQLKEHIPAYDFRHLVPPGLTGWAQINYPYGASIEDAIEKTSYDLYYVTNRSCIRDGLILLETIRVVLFAEGSR